MPVLRGYATLKELCGGWSVDCQRGSCMAQLRFFESQEEAAEKWNTRAAVRAHDAGHGRGNMPIEISDELRQLALD